MTTTAWTKAETTTKATDILVLFLQVAQKVGRFVAVCGGAYATQDSDFRGLDLNGNPMWAKRF